MRVAYEVHHFIHTRVKGNKCFMALKLDISEDYDRVEWCFLKKVLLRLGFDVPSVKTIMQCVSSVS